jgi:hypothetical protein
MIGFDLAASICDLAADRRSPLPALVLGLKAIPPSTIAGTPHRNPSEGQKMKYNLKNDAQLKELGNKLVDHLKGRHLLKNPGDTMGAFAAAAAIATKAVGFLPIGDGPNKVSDEEIAAAIPRIEGMLAILAACEE